MNLSIKARPTEYGGVHFRSRLEATWAAFFDLIQWRWEYEPANYGSWLPDFSICADGSPEGIILVEVKPSASVYPSTDVRSKIDASACGLSCIHVGLGPQDGDTLIGVPSAIIGAIRDGRSSYNEWTLAYLTKDNAGIDVCSLSCHLPSIQTGDHFSPMLSFIACRTLWGRAKLLTRYEPQ